MTKPDIPEDTGNGVVWVRTAPTPDGVYRVALELDEDTSHTLPPSAAVDHARHVLAACQRAEYDAAIFAQLLHVLGSKTGDRGDALKAAAQTVKDVHADRPPLPSSPAPFRLEPGVSAYTGRPFLRVHIRNQLIGQWTLPDAREHALHVLEAIEAADLDTGYYNALRTIIGLPEPRARAVVDGLAEYRHHEEEEKPR